MEQSEIPDPCPDCIESPLMQEAPQERMVLWGIMGHAKFPETTLVANHPLWRCSNCGYMSADWRAGEAQDAVAAVHLAERKSQCL